MNTSMSNGKLAAATVKAPRWSAVVATILVFASLALCSPMGEAQVGDPAIPGQDPRQARVIEIEGVSRWLKARFSKAELEALRPEDLRIESHFCSCYDKPAPHYPYSVVVFVTPKGDLVTRPEARDGPLQVTPLAVRDGERYCEVDPGLDCYGSFGQLCEFTDFRYGPYLAQFFPTCKSD